MSAQRNEKPPATDALDYLAAEITRKRALIESLRKEIDRDRLELSQRVHAFCALSHPLTAREREILPLVTQGLSNKEIASRVNLSVRTVKFHITNLLEKFDVKTRHQLSEPVI